MSEPIYLDYAATTPVDPAVVRLMGECLGPQGDFGNAASATHLFGRRAAARIEAARAQVAALIHATPEEIVLTSGATESNNLAILGIARANAQRGRHVLTSRIEHKAVLDPCRELQKEGFSVTYLSPDRSGRITPQSVEAALRSDTVLVSLMLANNETGVLQELAAIAALCQARGIPLHSDGAQAVGKITVDVRELPIDLLSLTAHKLYGPKGVGALYVRAAARASLKPVSFGGGHERGLRPGTLATHQVVGLGAACELAAEAQPAESARLAVLRDRLWQKLEALGNVHLNGEQAPRLPGLLSVSFEGVEGESLVTGLPELAVSTGAACNSASGEPSYVLRALGRDTQLAQASLRFSLGRFTTPADIEGAAEAVSGEVQRLRSVSPQAWPIPTGSGGPGRTPAQRAFIASSGQEAPLSALAWELFATLPRGGTFTPIEASGPLTVLRGEAGSAQQGTWVRFHLTLEGVPSIERGIVKDARFQAYGCPHTLATAAWLAGRLAGRRREALVPDSPQDWMRALAVPIEKLGRLLVIEDALLACVQAWPGP